MDHYSLRSKARDLGRLSRVTIVATLFLLAGPTTTARTVFDSPIKTAFAANRPRELELSAQFTMLPGTIGLEADLYASVIASLVDGFGISGYAEFYAISGARIEGDWALISVVGTDEFDPECDWRLQDAHFWGLVIAHRDHGGRWRAAVEGTIEYTNLISDVPDQLLSSRAKIRLDPLKNDVTAATEAASYIFPLARGSNFQYGTLGVHEAALISGGAAVDLLSNGGTGNAPNAIYAATDETIVGTVCADGTSMNIKTGSFAYLHFAPTSYLFTGQTFAQGQYMGTLISGNNSTKCGTTSQGSGSYHVHWEFPSAAITVEGWKLDPSKGKNAPWVKGDTSISPTQWMPSAWKTVAVPPLYSNSFESGLNGWNTWYNCSSDGKASATWYYTANDKPAAGGGSYALRLHTTGFTSGCSYPGMYAMSPSIVTTPGSTYSVQNMSRNANNSGLTFLIFMDKAGKTLSQPNVVWNSDSWAYNSDPTMIATAPTGATAMQVRFDLTTANAYADLDLLSIGKVALSFSTSFEKGITGWNTWYNCSSDGKASATSYNTANDKPAAGGGSYALRLRTTGFTSGCSYPGMYAMSPAVSATEGISYFVQNMSRNSTNSGLTFLLFMDKSGKVLSQTNVAWSSDSWAYNADQVLTAIAPIGTTSMQIRYDLTTANAYADLDMLNVWHN